MDHDSHSAPIPIEREHVIRQHNSLSQNIGGLFNTDLYSDLVLIVGEERFKVHKNILIARGEYFVRLLTNGMSETNKREVTIHDEPNVKAFEKLLRYVYSGEVKFDGTDDAIEMMRMANKYLFDELQRSFEDHLAAILSMENFCSIYSAALTCSASNLLAKCLSEADSKSNEVLKADGFSSLDVHAVHEITRRETFKPIQEDLFEAISNWIAMNEGVDEGGQVLSNIRLEDMSMGFLLGTVRSSKFFSESRILDAVAAISKKGSKEPGNLTPAQIHVTVFRNPYMKKITLPHQYLFDTIARVKVEVMVHFNSIEHSPIIRRSIGRSLSYGSISIHYKGTRLQEDRTLESYGVRDGDELLARCE